MGKVKESDLIKAFSENKEDVKKVNNHLSAAYLLMSIAMNHVDSALDVLKKYGLEFRDLKYYHNKIEQDFSRLHYSYRNMIDSSESQRNFNEDAATLEDSINKLMGL